jgi:hypothetical protein
MVIFTPFPNTWYGLYWNWKLIICVYMGADLVYAADSYKNNFRGVYHFTPQKRDNSSYNGNGIGSSSRTSDMKWDSTLNLKEKKLSEKTAT